MPRCATLRRWRTAAGRIGNIVTVLRTPTQSSWPNSVEAGFGRVPRDLLAHLQSRSMTDLQRPRRNWFAGWHAHARPRSPAFAGAVLQAAERRLLEARQLDVAEGIEGAAKAFDGRLSGPPAQRATAMLLAFAGHAAGVASERNLPNRPTVASAAIDIDDVRLWKRALRERAAIRRQFGPLLGVRSLAQKTR